MEIVVGGALEASSHGADCSALEWGIQASMTSQRPWVRREDTRQMFIEAGRAILREEGLGSGGEMLTLKRVRDRVEVDFGVRFTNASIIGRIWDNQSEYQTDVLATIAADDSNTEVEESLDLSLIHISEPTRPY